MQEFFVEMRIQDEVMKCVVFIGFDDEVGNFVPGGTAFLVSRQIGVSDISMLYLVTARHNIDSLRKRDRTVVIRLNRTDGSAERTNCSVDDWTVDPNDDFLDLAILPIAIDHLTIDYVHVAEQAILNRSSVKALDIGVGDELFFPGLFVHHSGATRNVPIMRFGTVAAIPEDKVQIKFPESGSHPIDAYLAEARSIGGLSGSPVFVRTDGVRGTSVAITEPRFSLLGLMRGHWDETLVESSTPTHWGQAEAVNMGISIIVPAWKILELTNLLEHAEHRNREADRLRSNYEATD